MCELSSSGAFVGLCGFNIKKQRNLRAVLNALLKMNSGDVGEWKEGKGGQGRSVAHSSSALLL